MYFCNFHSVFFVTAYSNHMPLILYFVCNEVVPPGRVTFPDGQLQVQMLSQLVEGQQQGLMLCPLVEGAVLTQSTFKIAELPALRPSSPITLPRSSPD